MIDDPDPAPALSTDLTAMSGEKLVEREQQLAIEHAWRVKGDGSRTNSITGETQQPPERAPVQGYGRGIPWSLHLDAYDAYSKKWGAQIALIDWNGRGCRGGFGTKELDNFIPGWREKVSEIEALKATIEQLQARLAEAEGVVRPFAGIPLCYPRHRSKVLPAELDSSAPAQAYSANDVCRVRAFLTANKDTVR